MVKLLQKLKESMINENEEKPITNDPVDYNSDNNLKNMQNPGINKRLEKQISTPSNFMEFVELFKEKGEMLLYSQIKSSVHLVSFNVGEIVIRISGHPEKTLSKENLSIIFFKFLRYIKFHLGNLLSIKTPSRNGQDDIKSA